MKYLKENFILNFTFFNLHQSWKLHCNFLQNQNSFLRLHLQTMAKADQFRHCLVQYWKLQEVVELIPSFILLSLNLNFIKALQSHITFMGDSFVLFDHCVRKPSHLLFYFCLFFIIQNFLFKIPKYLLWFVNL